MSATKSTSTAAMGTPGPRAVAEVKFRAPVEIREGVFVRQLKAGEQIQTPAGFFDCPRIFRDPVTAEFVVGDWRIPVQSGLVAQYKFAPATVGTSKP